MKSKVLSVPLFLVIAAMLFIVAATAQAATTEGHAAGTFTWDSTAGVLTLNFTSSDFICDGPNIGTVTFSGVTITSTTMTFPEDAWSRSGGTVGNIVGTWTSSSSTTGNSFTLTFNADGTASMTGVIVSCGSTGTGGSGGTIAPIAQVVNNSGVSIDHLKVGNIAFTSVNPNGSTAPLDVSEGTNNIKVYQTATSTPVSLGSLGPFSTGNFYAVNILKLRDSYCAELWQIQNRNAYFNSDTTRQIIGSTCCSASVSASLLVNIPIVTFSGVNYWLDLQFNTADSTLAVANAGNADGIYFGSCTASTLSSAFKLHVPALTIGNISYWVDLQWNGSVFVVAGAGQN